MHDKTLWLRMLWYWDSAALGMLKGQGHSSVSALLIIRDIPCEMHSVPAGYYFDI